MQRMIAAVLAVPNIANGLMMLVAGPFGTRAYPELPIPDRSIRTLSRTLARRSWFQASLWLFAPGGQPIGRQPSPARAFSPPMA